MTSRARSVTWASADEKVQWLDANASLDAIKRPVERLAERLSDGLTSPGAIVEKVFLFWRDAIRYTRDVRDHDGKRGEQFADTSTILTRGYDDCDGKSRGFVATIRAVAKLRHTPRLEARIQPVFRGEDFVHVQAEVRWPGSTAHPKARADGWVLAELTLAGVPLGSGVEAGTRGPDGQLKTT